MGADAFELGEHPGYGASKPVRVGSVACERFQLDIFGALVGMMSVGAEVLRRITGGLAEAYDVGRRSHVADLSRALGHFTLIGVAREIRAAGAAGTRAAG